MAASSADSYKTYNKNKEYYKNNSHFEYKKVKYNFATSCIAYVKDNGLEDIWPCTYEAISLIKETILEGKDFIQKHKRLSKTHLRYMSLYAMGNNRILVTKGEKRKKVIDVFLLFDVILQAHKVNKTHRDLKDTLNALNPLYYVPKKAIDIFISVCNVCKYNKKINTNGEPENTLQMSTDQNSEHLVFAKDIKAEDTNLINDTDTFVRIIPHEVIATDTTIGNNKTKQQQIFIDVIAMDEKDGEFNNILIYTDIFTKYTLLRPLVSFEKEEVSLEIFRIFADFGVPDEINYISKVSKIFQDALQLLQFNFSTGKIKQNVLSTESILYVTNIVGRKIKNRLKKWTTITMSRNWAVGCYIVQQNFNTEKSPESPYSPFELTFRKLMDANVTLKTIEKEVNSDLTKKSSEKASTQIETYSELTKDRRLNEVLDFSDLELGSNLMNLEKDPIDLKTDEVMEIEEDPFKDIAYASIGLQNIQNEEVMEAPPSALEDEDTLEAFETTEETNVANSLQNTQNARTLFEKSYESFAKQTLFDWENKKKKSRAGKYRKTASETGNTEELDDDIKEENTLESICDIVKEETDLPEIKTTESCSNFFKEENDPLAFDMLETNNDSAKCHVCGRELCNDINLVQCLQCNQRVHQMCSSTTYKQNDQNICLACMFKDGVPDDSVDE